jgi:hypothetical protein
MVKVLLFLISIFQISFSILIILRPTWIRKLPKIKSSYDRFGEKKTSLLYIGLGVLGLMIGVMEFFIVIK